MLQNIIKLVEENLLRDKYLVSTMLLLSDAGMLIVDLGDGFSSDKKKENTVLKVAEIIKQNKIYASYIISEAWAYEADKNLDKAILEEYIKDGSYREKIKRRECYTVNEIKKSSSTSATRYYNRGEDNSIEFVDDVVICDNAQLIRFKPIQDALTAIA